jgi:hypothetical protein
LESDIQQQMRRCSHLAVLLGSDRARYICGQSCSGRFCVLLIDVLPCVCCHARPSRSFSFICSLREAHALNRTLIVDTFIGMSKYVTCTVSGRLCAAFAAYAGSATHICLRQPCAHTKHWRSSLYCRPCASFQLLAFLLCVAERILQAVKTPRCHSPHGTATRY